ncbi:MAG: T9SS type A sorting domain-containing protein [Chlorobi bacterium]|nr:T9SS type A sorting domain-containing protein [Chlorobiota bacterium]
MIKAWFVCTLMIFAASRLCAQTVVINEIMSSNTVSITDEDGDFEDWIELYNPDSEAVSIFGWSITDDISNPGKWLFPEFSINPNNFILVFASAKDRSNSVYFHSNFKISASGEAVYLFNENGLLMDSFPAVEIEADKSFGRFPDAAPNLVRFYHFSPWNSNNQSNVLNQLNCSHPSGFYAQSFDIAINSDGGDSIYCTLNGSDPHPDSLGTFLFTGALSINSLEGEANGFTGIRTSPVQNTLYPWNPPQGPVFKARVLRACSFRNQKPSSNISTFTYFVSPDIQGKYSFPVVSVVLDSNHLFAQDTGIYVPGIHYDPLIYKTGNYYMTGKFWERRGYVEMFSPEGDTILSQECGIRIHGNLSREYPQKSLRLYARKEYGNETFNPNVFQGSFQYGFKRLVFRTPLSSHEFTMFKDPLIHDLVEGLNVKTVAFRPVVVFLNGEYWGVHNLRERVDGFFYEMHYNINVDNLDQLSGIGDVNHGDSLGYLGLMEFVEGNSLSEDENFQYVASQIDLDNYIDYYIIETWFSNIDWPGNNYEYWRSSDLDNKWRWQLLDMDATFGSYEFNMFEHISAINGDSLLNPPWSTLLFRKLIENPGFVEDFVNRYEYVSQNYLNTERIVSRIDEFEKMYEIELPEHIERWSLPEKIDVFYSHVEWMRKFSRKRPCVVKKQLQDFFHIENVDIYCDSLSFNDSIPNYERVNIYPNPARDEIHISYYSEIETNLSVQIVNMNGQGVFTKSYNLLEGNNEFSLNLFQVRNGLCVIEIKTAYNISHRKILVNKN